MNRRRMIRSMTFVLAVIPLIALATSFDWNGRSGAFNDYTKWTPRTVACVIPEDCYPRSCNDDAIMVIDALATVTISTQTIDDLTLIPEGSGLDVTTLDGGGGAPQTLTCDTLTIDMTGNRTLFLQNNAIIKTAACP